MEPVAFVPRRRVARVNRSICVFALLALFASFSSCGDAGPEKYSVSGVVSYNGKPLTTGNVMFVPEAGGSPAACLVGADGSYRLQAVAGRHRVGVTAVPAPPPGTNEKHYHASPSLVPAKYGRPDTSGLVVEVQPSENNNIDIRLQ